MMLGRFGGNAGLQGRQRKCLADRKRLFRGMEPLNFGETNTPVRGKANQMDTLTISRGCPLHRTRANKILVVP